MIIETTSLNFLKLKNVNPDVRVTDDCAIARNNRFEYVSSLFHKTIANVCAVTSKKKMIISRFVCVDEKRKFEILVGDLRMYNSGFFVVMTFDFLSNALWRMKMRNRSPIGMPINPMTHIVTITQIITGSCVTSNDDGVMVEPTLFHPETTMNRL